VGFILLIGHSLGLGYLYYWEASFGEELGLFPLTSHFINLKPKQGFGYFIPLFYPILYLNLVPLLFGLY